jgi:hypothetical protein
MARAKKKNDEGQESGRQLNLFWVEHLKISTSPQVMNALDELVKRGLFGKTPTEVAEGLIRSKIIELGIPLDVLQRRRKPPKSRPRRTERLTKLAG